MVMARYLFIAFAILGLSIQIIFAQNIGDKPADAPIQVTEFQVSLVNVMKWDSGSGMGGMGGMGSTPMGTGSMKGDDRQLLFSLKCKNSGDKQTSVIYWQSRFTDNKEHLVQKQFKTKKKIKAGKDDTIEEPLAFDLGLLPGMVKVGYRITKIEYSDNSTWESIVKEDPETAYTFKLYKLQ